MREALVPILASACLLVLGSAAVAAPATDGLAQSPVPPTAALSAPAPVRAPLAAEGDWVEASLHSTEDPAPDGPGECFQAHVAGERVLAYCSIPTPVSDFDHGVGPDRLAGDWVAVTLTSVDEPAPNGPGECLRVNVLGNDVAGYCSAPTPLEGFDHRVGPGRLAGEWAGATLATGEQPDGTTAQCGRVHVLGNLVLGYCSAPTAVEDTTLGVGPDDLPGLP